MQWLGMRVHYIEKHKRSCYGKWCDKLIIGVAAVNCVLGVIGNATIRYCMKMVAIQDFGAVRGAL